MPAEISNRCISCGKIIERSASGYNNHKCSPQHEAGKKAAARTYYRKERAESYSARLSYGFRFMNGDY